MSNNDGAFDEPDGVGDYFAAGMFTLFVLGLVGGGLFVAHLAVGALGGYVLVGKYVLVTAAIIVGIILLGYVVTGAVLRDLGGWLD